MLRRGHSPAGITPGRDVSSTPITDRGTERLWIRNDRSTRSIGRSSTPNVESSSAWMAVALIVCPCWPPRCFRQNGTSPPPDSTTSTGDTAPDPCARHDPQTSRKRAG